MHVKHILAAGPTIGHVQVRALPGHATGGQGRLDALGRREQGGARLLVELAQIGEVLLRRHDAVAGAERPDVQERQHRLVLIDDTGGHRAGNDIAEYAVHAYSGA